MGLCWVMFNHLLSRRSFVDVACILGSSGGADPAESSPIKRNFSYPPAKLPKCNFYSDYGLSGGSWRLTWQKFHFYVSHTEKTVLHLSFTISSSLPPNRRLQPKGEPKLYQACSSRATSDSYSLRTVMMSQFLPLSAISGDDHNPRNFEKLGKKLWSFKYYIITEYI